MNRRTPGEQRWWRVKLALLPCLLVAWACTMTYGNLHRIVGLLISAAFLFAVMAALILADGRERAAARRAGKWTLR